MRVVLVVCALVATVCATRGVQNSKASFYEGPADGTFRCLDGSGTIPKRFVNDEFCDCADGSDEPGTSACALVTLANAEYKFQCTDTSYGVHEVSHTVVNDARCDCCDGSDEYLTGKQCPNTCAAAHEEAEKERAKREASRQLGLKAKEALLATAALKRAEMKAKLSEEESKTVTLAADLKAAEAARDVAEIDEQAERAKIKAKSEQDFALWSAEQAAKKAAQAAASLESPPPQENQQVICSKWRQTKDCIGSGERQPEDDKECEAVIPDGWSGYCDCVDTATMSEVRFDFDCGHKSLTCAYVCTHNGAEPETTEPQKEETFVIDDGSKFELPAAVSTRDKVRDIKRQLEEAERRVKDLEADLSRDYGPDDVLLALKDTCHELDAREYTYKMCVFGDIRQQRKGTGHGPSMGRFKSFGEQSYSSWGAKQDYTHMKFGDGESCWGGPSRSTDVHVVCGADSQLLSVEEPSMCAYRMVFQTPAICE